MKRVLSLLTLWMYFTQLVVSCGPTVESVWDSSSDPLPTHSALSGDQELPPLAGAIVPSERDSTGLVPGTTPGSFEVTADGAATYHVPLWVPPGRAGIQPSLSLNYHSRSGNGLLGVGWGLGGLSQISRCNKTSVQDGAPAPVMFDASDAFCLDGKRLVQVGSTSSGERTFTTEVEEFSHVVARQEDSKGPSWFEVQLKNGLVLEFGRDGASRVEGYRMHFVPGSSNLADATVVADHTSQTVRLGWSLSRLRDRQGNYLSVEYELRVHGGGGVQEGYGYEQLPRALRYTGSTTDASVGTPQRVVWFDYDEVSERPDRTERFVSGFKLVSARRMKTIRMLGPGSTQPLRSYSFTYRNDSVSGRSLLSTLQECDAQGACKRPTTFTWELSGPRVGRELLPAGGDDFFLRVPVSAATPSPAENGGIPDSEGFASAPDFWTLQTLDINGDGRDDIMYRFSRSVGLRLQPPRWYVRLNTNGRDFGPPVELPNLPEARSGDTADDLRTVDLNNDGKVDVVGLYLPDVTTGTNGRYQFHFSNGTGFAAGQNDIFDFWFDQTQPARVPSLHLADLDGNGYPDAVRSLTRTTGSSLPYEWGARLTDVDTSGGPVFPAANQRTAVGAGLDHAGYAVDVDGDGATELLVREPQSGPADGYSRFLVALGRTGPGVVGKKLTTTLSTLPVPNSYNPYIYRQHWFIDINGDGLPDSVSAKRERQGLQGAGNLEISINTGNGFAPPVTQVMPEGAEVSFGRLHPSHRLADVGVRVLDFNQDGRQDLLLTDYGYGVSTRTTHVVLESNGTGFNVRTLAIPVGQLPGRGNVQSVSSDDPSKYSMKGSGWGMKLTQLLDANGDGLTDIIQMEGGQLVLYLRNGYKTDVLKAVVDGLSNRVDVSYEATTFTSPSKTANHHASAVCTYPQSCNLRAQWLVTLHSEQSWDSPVRNFTYSYAGGRTDLLGRGWLGFSERTQVDEKAFKRTTTRYHNDRRTLGFYLEAHRPYEEKTSVTMASGLEDSFQRNLTYQYQAKAGNKVVFPFTYTVTETETAGDVGVIRQHSATNTYDSYGNITRHEETAQDGSTTVTVDAYDNYPTQGAHLLGLLRNRSVTSTVPGLPSVTRTTGYEYCDGVGCLPTTNLPRRVTVEPGATSPERDDVWLQTEFTYNALGLVTRVESTDTAARKRRTQVQYDAAERLFVSAQLEYPSPDDPNAPVLRTDLAHDRGLGVPTVQQSPVGTQTRWYYDAFGRQRAEDGPDSADVVVSYGVDAERPLVDLREVDFASCGPATVGPNLSSCARNGTESQVAFDMMGREVRRKTRGFDGGWSVVETTYDALGRVETRSMPRTELGPILNERFTYDRRGRLLTLIHPDGTFQERKYEGLKTLTWDEKRNAGYLLQDSLGRNIRSGNVTATGTVIARYEYGPFSLPRRIIDDQGNDTLVEYDRLGRRTLLDDPDAGQRRAWYSAFGQVRTQTDGNGNTVTRTYDGLGRATSISNQPAASGSPAQVTSLSWDTALNGLGALHQATSPDGVVQTYEYDALGRPAHERWNVQGQEYRLSMTYDALGRLQTLGYPEVAGRARMGVFYDYTAFGHLAAVRNVNTGHAYWTATARNAAGLLTGETFGNGVTSTRRYDALNQLRFIDTTGAAGSVQQLAYVYEDNGNLKSRVDRLAQVTEDFQYDALNRLTQWKVNKGCNNALFQYGYDVLGNLTYRSSKLGTTSQAPFEERTYVYGAGSAGPHAVTSVGADAYAYDGNGNLRQRQLAGGALRQLAYTYFNLPSQVTEGTRQWTFGYDAHQRRTFKQDNQGASTVYIGGLYERRTRPDTTISHVFYVPGGDGVAAQVEWSDVPAPGAESVAYLHTDHLGSVESVTGSGGAIVGRYKYDPFGLRKNASNPALPHAGGALASQLGFTGHEEDDDLGLVNMKGRMYDPRLGRFLSPDPIVQAPLFSQSLNRYSYVLNNPLTLTDPTGLSAEGPPSTEFFEEDFTPDVIVAGRPEPELVKATGGQTLTTTSSVFAPGEYDFWVPAAAAASKTDAGAADPNGSRVSGVEAGAYALAGVLSGLGMGVGTAYGLGVVAAFSPPGALALGLGMTAYGIYHLVNGGGQALWESGARILDGRGTAADFYGVGAVVGGLASGRFAKAARLTGKAHGQQAISKVQSTFRSSPAVSVHGRSNGQDYRPPTYIRQVEHGESLIGLAEELDGLTRALNEEHAVISLGGRQRWIVSGGRDGIDFAPGSFRRLIMHTHTRGSEPGPSPADFAALSSLRQRFSYLIEVDHPFPENFSIFSQ
ncbi:FG-GAP-like repeat-containing protein [Myxococcus sp. K15C18031901]|uniref:RHS repeat-associated core domain-containing protein n=1 Tax=Myxococcus dinghuensis TaxID=2906761 RepID=UPI0020A7A827|nr:RHS repeat-associated core domain-containing protein [Myxococcus dinghuensis]MCP3097667.1 FG-GAP-like repeat-containing protein [Myxococcus dinghuensis]